MYLLKAYEGLYKIHDKVCPKSDTPRTALYFRFS